MLLTIVLWLIAVAVLAALATAGYFALLTRRIAAEAEAKVPPVGRFLDVGGHRIHYVDEGQGPPIVFVHGLGAQLHQFRGPLFPAFGSGYRLIAFDRPGSGYSRPARGWGGRLPEQADLLRAFIEVLGLGRPLVVGHSLGGAVALALALEHPEAVSGLALLSPLTHLETELRPEFAPLYMPSRLKRWIVSRTVAIPRARKLADATLAFIFSPQAPTADYMVTGGGWAGLRPDHFYGTVTDFTAIPRDLGAIEARIGEIAVPAGLLFGTADRVLDFALHGAPMRERIRGLDFEVMEGMGHMPHFIEPRRTADFIRRVAARAFAANRS